uniref:AlNc14C96G5866 protein n=1 Tax=Albugo laibachii Nc14 TaxID=890382 RepID=F0WGZ0_9STRA|nr:AlNc14C96G5866 [Albugo laibachii Nc14]|eukprot:CCA20505.1 AlNc14C96G5866 [Albugo laibachii Nc14]
MQNNSSLKHGFLLSHFFMKLSPLHMTQINLHADYRIAWMVTPHRSALPLHGTYTCCVSKTRSLIMGLNCRFPCTIGGNRQESDSTPHAEAYRMRWSSIVEGKTSTSLQHIEALHQKTGIYRRKVSLHRFECIGRTIILRKANTIREKPAQEIKTKFDLAGLNASSIFLNSAKMDTFLFVM